MEVFTAKQSAVNKKRMEVSSRPSSGKKEWVEENVFRQVYRYVYFNRTSFIFFVP